MGSYLLGNKGSLVRGYLQPYYAKIAYEPFKNQYPQLIYVAMGKPALAYH